MKIICPSSFFIKLSVIYYFQVPNSFPNESNSAIKIKFAQNFKNFAEDAIVFAIVSGVLFSFPGTNKFLSLA